MELSGIIYPVFPSIFGRGFYFKVMQLLLVGDTGYFVPLHSAKFQYDGCRLGVLGVEKEQ